MLPFRPFFSSRDRSLYGIPQGRQLADQDVLHLLEGPGTADLRWRYLEHLVQGEGSRNPLHHTLLALGLADAALLLMTPPDPTCALHDPPRSPSVMGWGW